MTLCAECAVKMGYKGKPDYERHVCAFCGRVTYGYIVKEEEDGAKTDRRKRFKR